MSSRIEKLIVENTTLSKGEGMLSRVNLDVWPLLLRDMSMRCL